MEKLLKHTLVHQAFVDVKPAHTKMMRAIKCTGNKTTELNFCLALIEAKISGWQLHAKLKGKPDILFPEYKIVIFLDGCFWHGCPECGHIPKTNSLYWQTKLNRNIERDKANTESLIKDGYSVIRFWEHEILNDVNGCIAYVNDVIELQILSQDYYISNL